MPSKKQDNHSYSNIKEIKAPILVAWESTRACNLLCRHCRAEAILSPPDGELSHQEGIDFIDQISAWGPRPPMLILSGGEPLLRDDIFELARYGKDKGLRVLLSTNGFLLDDNIAKAIKSSGIAAVSLSLDGTEPKSHDDFRGVKGSFAAVEKAAAHLAEHKIHFQINSSLTAANLDQAKSLSEIAVKLKASAHHIFLLVPVGRAIGMEKALSAEEYEAALKNLALGEAALPIEFKATCAPQYQRIRHELGLEASSRHHGVRGCLAGQGFVFVSSEGELRGCGYLPLAAGNIRQKPLREIYEFSELFVSLRNKENYKGKCGLCEYWNICGGCRARAQAVSEHLGPEPLCPYQPKQLKPDAI